MKPGQPSFHRSLLTSGQAVEPYYHLLKRPDGHQILFAYDKRGTPTVSLTLNTPGTKAISYSLDGKMQAFRNFDGNTLAGVQLAPGQIQVLEILPYLILGIRRRVLTNSVASGEHPKSAFNTSDGA